MTYLHLVPTGLGDPETAGLGKLGGRFVPSTRKFAGRPCYWADQTDTGKGVTASRQHRQALGRAPAKRFRAPPDWCVRTVPNANHPPRVSSMAAMARM